MARPSDPSPLVPRQPASVLGLAMRQLRELHGVSASALARAFGCHPSYISRVERGARPSLELVLQYEQQFEADGMLLSLWEAVAGVAHERRRRGRPAQVVRAIPGDASTLIDETVPNGTLLAPGVLFVKTWQIRNSGSVPWRHRRLTRQGPVTGPGLVTSLRSIEISDTEPGEPVEIEMPLKAPGYDCTSIAYFKMTDRDGNLCFPDDYQLGLDVLVTVRGQQPTRRRPGSSAHAR